MHLFWNYDEVYFSQIIAPAIRLILFLQIDEVFFAQNTLRNLSFWNFEYAVLLVPEKSSI